MPCNWLAIVRADGEARACVFCGQHRREQSKPVSVASVLLLLDEQDPALHDELFARTLRNMCAGALASHAQWQPQEREAMFGACLCCHHWVSRRKKGRLLFLLQALSWYVNTMLPVGAKNMDHRVVMRLSTTLVARGPLPADACAGDTRVAHDTGVRTDGTDGTDSMDTTDTTDTAHTTHTTDTRAANHYSTLFNTQEQKLFAAIAAGCIDNVGDLIAEFYHSENASTIFSPSTAIVEKLRKSQARSCRAE